LNEKGEVIAKTVEVYEYGTVAIKLHEVTESKIIGEAFFTDTDKDGFSDSWERAYGFDPENNADGGPVYVAPGGDDGQGWGTLASPYKTLAQGIKKARSGLSEETRTVLVDGILTRDSGNPGSDTAVMYIADTGPRGVTVTGLGTSSAINAASTLSDQKSALYLGPGTKLTLKNITIKSGWAYRGGGVRADGAALTLGPGAVIQNCHGAAGGGIYGFNGAAIVMENGSLIGGDAFATANKASDGVGAAVALYNGASLTMKGGSRISYNEAARGGVVSAEQGSLVTMEDGAAITGNYDKYYPSAQIISYGGGGVRLAGKSTLLMTGGLIAGNLISKGGGGGGVYVSGESVLDMRGGTIRDNTAEKPGGSDMSKGNGGGVYVDTGGIIRMTGGEIANNTAGGKGGGVYVKGGSISKRGGTIYGSSDAAQNTMDSTTPNALYIDLTPNTPISENGTLSGPVTYP
jgi:hypothetical protein